MQKTAHIIGAGISGLSAAVRLANANYRVHVHEATQTAGGRCRKPRARLTCPRSLVQPSSYSRPPSIMGATEACRIDSQAAAASLRRKAAPHGQ